MTLRVPPAPGRDKRHRRHSTKTMKLVRDMAAAGWTPTQIQRYLSSQGVDPPHENTIARWSSDERQDRVNRRRVEARRYRARKRDWHNLSARWCERDWKDRMIELRTDAGLTCSAIARLLRHDLGVDITEEQVRSLVGNLERGTA